MDTLYTVYQYIFTPTSVGKDICFVWLCVRIYIRKCTEWDNIYEYMNCSQLDRSSGSRRGQCWALVVQSHSYSYPESAEAVQGHAVDLTQQLHVPEHRAALVLVPCALHECTRIVLIRLLLPFAFLFSFVLFLLMQLLFPLSTEKAYLLILYFLIFSCFVFL